MVVFLFSLLLLFLSLLFFINLPPGFQNKHAGGEAVLRKISKLKKWQISVGLINEHVCAATKKVDPKGVGITSRTFSALKTSGACQLRTALLLLAAHGEGSETWPPLSLHELDAEGILERRG